jgi:hypothetical protein
MKEAKQTGSAGFRRLHVEVYAQQRLIRKLMLAVDMVVKTAGLRAGMTSD